MRTTRLLLFLILGMVTLPAYAERYSSSGEALFVGALQGLLIMLVVWLWNIFKGKKNSSKTESKKPVSSQPKSISTVIKPSQKTAWEQFKASNQELATSIASITNEDLSQLNSKDLNDKITTFKHMANHFKCAIPNLKDVCINSFTHEFSKEELPDVIDKLSKRALEESVRCSISKESTTSHYIQVWLNDYISC